MSSQSPPRPDSDGSALSSFGARFASRRGFLRSTAISGGAALLAACGAPNAAPPAAAPSGSSGQAQEWEALVQAARAEGVVSLNAGPGGDLRSALIESFEKDYPGIKVEAAFSPAAETLARIQAERTAGKYLVDVLVGVATTALLTLKPIGALAPMKPALVLPEVLDESAWLENRLWWIDESEPYASLMFQGNAEPLVTYNTQLVDPRQFTSYYDLLDPKWKGKIVAYDLRQPGGGATLTRFIYKHPDLGPPFLERIFGEMDLQLSGDQRQLVDWVAQGRYELGLLLASPSVYLALNQGLPLNMIPGDQLREGTAIGVGQGSVNLIDRGPHPNAAKVYVNWLLSRAGQGAWQRIQGGNSLRTDLPKDGLYPATVPKPGARYMNVNTEEFARISASTISDIVTQAMEKRST